MASRLEEVRARIARAGAEADRVRIVGVTKGLGEAEVRAALSAGLLDLGENYAGELRGKAATARAGRLPVRWHYLGTVQRNKVPSLVPLVHLWQGVSRLEEGAAIARRVAGARVLVQVRLEDRPGRNGCHPEEAPELVRRLSGLGLDVQGLMGVAPTGGPEGTRASFRALAALRSELGLAELSMGMTDDLEIAVQEGATIVRVGRALFGERPTVGGLEQ